jgi:hypothetical protein
MRGVGTAAAGFYVLLASEQQQPAENVQHGTACRKLLAGNCLDKSRHATSSSAKQ